MIERDREEDFLAWFAANRPADGSGVNPRLSVMRMSGGVDYRQAEAQSIAYQLEFESRADAELWLASSLPDVAARFEERYAPNALIFNSIFESIPL